MRILIYTPRHPKYGIRTQTLDAIRVLRQFTKHQTTWTMDSGTHVHPHPYQNITANYNWARQKALNEGYDALLTIEADMIPPPETIDLLADAPADVVYGLYIFRQGKQWSAYQRLGLFGARSYSMDPDLARESWGKTIEVGGLGMGCTLIHRRVLERIPFRLYEGKDDDWLLEAYAEKAARQSIPINLKLPRYTMMANDWLFGLDLQHYGYKQVCETRVVCGHIDDQHVYWPDPVASELYKSVPVTHK